MSKVVLYEKSVEIEDTTKQFEKEHINSEIKEKANLLLKIDFRLSDIQLSPN